MGIPHLGNYEPPYSYTIHSAVVKQPCQLIWWRLKESSNVALMFQVLSFQTCKVPGPQTNTNNHMK